MDADLALAGDRRLRQPSRVVSASAAARVTSSTVIRPPGPVPVSPWRETPSSTAVRRATGVATGRPGAEPSVSGPRLGAPGSQRGAEPPARAAGRRPCVAACRAVAVRKRRDRLSDGHRRALRDEDRVERPVPLGLVDHGGLVGLDLDQALAPREGLARRLQPAEDHRVGHRVGELRHRQLARRHGVSP